MVKMAEGGRIWMEHSERIFILKVETSLARQGDILAEAWWVQSSFFKMQLKSPPMQPESCLLRRSCGMVAAEYSSLSALDRESDPEGR